MTEITYEESSATAEFSALRNVAVMWDDGPSTSLSALQHGLQQALADQGLRVVHRQRSPAARRLARVLSKLKLVRPIAPRSGRKSFTVLSWASDVRAFPDTYWRELVPWIFDCWEPHFDRWEALLKRHKVETAFFSARDTARYFAEHMPGMTAIWVPEACDPTVFRPHKPLTERSIDVLEMGRRWPQIHERIRSSLSEAGIRHIYNGIDGRKQLFKDSHELHEACGDAVIMLCFPKSLTHPHEAGNIETLTQRYFEAIGSGCLPVGRAPQELIELFGFNPVIELSMSDPARHLQEIIANVSSYEQMTKQSLARLQQVGTFQERAKRIVAALAS
jgi:hypothetical protein